MTAVDTHLLLRALFDELSRCGMAAAVTCPGSRNTPLVEAIVAEPRLTAWSHIDERCAGFFAVGAAKASGRPVAVTVTSGSAVANLMPAVVEASEANLGVILLTADRPAELRQIGAGQTIDQVKLFGPYVRFFAELDLYEATPQRMRWVRAMACRAYWTALETGPVHLNVPLREPLVLDGPLPEDPPGGGGRPQRARPWISSVPTEPTLPTGGMDILPRSVVVAGACAPGVAAAAARFCERHGFPLLADPLSGARRGGAAIAHYDLLLREPEFAARCVPAMIIRVGDLPTSKPLRSWLASVTGSTQISLGRGRGWADPASVVEASFPVDPVAVLDAATLRGEPEPAWLAGWRSADALAATAIDTVVGSELSEPAVVRSLATALPPQATLYVAASMPIRDVEEFFPVRTTPPRVLANRGANGIDGTVSSAFGAAAVAPADPTVLLIGDVALLHDIGGLLAAKRTQLKLTIVLINNDGGGIFNFLAIAAGHEAAFTEHVATPHGTDFRHAAALYGLDHMTATDVGGFIAALGRALDARTSTLIEVRTDRAANRQLHAEIERATRAALAPTLSRPAPGAAPGA